MKPKMFKNPSGFVYGSGNLVQFRAGRMNLIGKMVHADTRKGLIYVRQAEDGLLHFCWKDRATDKVEDDLILFPEDFEYRRVDKCTTGRVYVMIFKTSPCRMFYWMQEKKSNKDKEYCTRINELINKPPPASRQRATNGFTSSLFNNMSHQQLINLFNDVTHRQDSTSNSGSMKTNVSTTSSASDIPTLNTNGSVNTLPESTNLNTSAGATAVLRKKRANTSKKKTKPRKKSAKKSSKVDLNDVFNDFKTSELFQEIISNSEYVNKLAMFLPKIEGDNEDRKQLIKDQMSTPEFQRTMYDFCEAFPSKILGALLRSLQLPSNAVTAATSGNLESFLRALEVNNNPEVIMGDVEENNKNSQRGDKRKREPEPDEHNSKRK